MTYRIVKENRDGYDFHGLIDATGGEVVPHIHAKPEEAISELVYYLKMNQQRRFLADELSDEQIEELKNELLEQAKTLN